MMTLGTEGAILANQTSRYSCGGRTAAHHPGPLVHRPGISCALGLRESTGGLY